MTRQRALQRLFLLWAILPAVPLLIITVQALSGKYGDSAGVAWSWYLIQVTPAVALLSAAAFSNPSKAWQRGIVSPFKWRLALSLTVLQSVCMLSALMAEPLLQATIYEVFERTSVALSLLQGMVVASIGAVVFDGR